MCTGFLQHFLAQLQFGCATNSFLPFFVLTTEIKEDGLKSIKILV